MAPRKSTAFLQYLSSVLNRTAARLLHCYLFDSYLLFSRVRQRRLPASVGHDLCISLLFNTFFHALNAICQISRSVCSVTPRAPGPCTATQADWSRTTVFLSISDRCSISCNTITPSTMATKTTFFGTTFAFNQEGIDDVIKIFQDIYLDSADEAPFMSYDPKHHVSWFFDSHHGAAVDLVTGIQDRQVGPPR
jgi:hypothetical protein